MRQRHNAIASIASGRNKPGMAPEQEFITSARFYWEWAQVHVPDLAGRRHLILLHSSTAGRRHVEGLVPTVSLQCGRHTGQRQRRHCYLRYTHELCDSPADALPMPSKVSTSPGTPLLRSNASLTQAHRVSFYNLSYVKLPSSRDSGSSAYNEA
ncbi:hypothetical protein A0H81_11367 [Grifola frondosa]|uniref:Uncharacterized protein n=1 Tax=Grifola frondosa TaxID=5627 RepID=A0A1C7LX23_GRIFR|nr:hypothetical protein A0H81_11367 [Grifola frondosa]